MNVVLAWELGLGRSHITNNLDWAKELVLRGHKVTFVVKDLHLANTLLTPWGIRCVSAPSVKLAKLPQHAVCSYADVIRFHGMADSQVSAELFGAWVELYKILSPDVVVIDHAPAALFAAKCRRIKTLELATGFTRPPALTPFPSFRPWEATTAIELKGREDECLIAMNGFATLLGHQIFKTLPHALSADVTLFCTFAELDHYPQRLAGHYVGPIHAYTDGEVVRWTGTNRYRVFIYMHHLRGCAHILSRMAALDAEVIAFCPDLAPDQRRSLASPRMQMLENAAQIATLLPQCSLVVSNGGQGLAAACVLFGVPSLVLPLHIEQRLLADCLRRSGTGIGLPVQSIKTTFESTVERLLTAPGIQTACHKLKDKYRAYDFSATLVELVNTIEKLAAMSAGQGQQHAMLPTQID